MQYPPLWIVSSAAASTLFLAGGAWWWSASEQHEPVIVNVEATALALSVSPDRLRRAVGRVDMRRYDSLDDNEAAASAWFEANKGRFKGDPEEVAPFVALIRKAGVGPLDDPFAVEDPVQIGYTICGFWCLAQTWHEVGHLYGADSDEMIGHIERASRTNDESLLVPIGLLTQIMVLYLGDDAPRELVAVRDRLFDNDYVAMEVRRKIDAWDQNHGRARHGGTGRD